MSVLLVLLLLVGCLYDEAERCTADRRFEDGVCVCLAGTIEDDGRCVQAQDAGAPPAADDDDAGPQACSDHARCDGSDFCSAGHCRPLPTGQGAPCASQDDCAGLEASFCTVGSPFGVTCVVPDCTEDSCSPGWQCTDLSGIAPGTPPLCLELT